MFLNMDFIAQGLVMLLGGIASALVLFGFAWWAPLLLLAAWGSTHWLLRESGVWRDRNTDEVKTARRHTDYAYTLATEPAAAKEVRLFGLSPWLLERFTSHRLRLHQLQYDATRLRERSLGGALVIVLAANALLFWLLARQGYDGQLDLQAVVTYAGAAFGASSIAFGGLSWALDGAAAPVVAIRSLEPAMASAGALSAHRPTPARRRPARPRSGSATSRSPTRRAAARCSTASTSPSRRVRRWRSSGRTAPARRPWPSCSVVSTTPSSGSIEVDGVDLRDLDLDQWRRHVAAVFQDFVRYELPLRVNVAPLGRDDRIVEAALEQAGALGLADLDAPMAKGYAGGVDLSGGQWQRVALARALAEVGAGADVVLLDEPTAMLDVRGEAEIFRRVLGATAEATTILVSTASPPCGRPT